MNEVRRNQQYNERPPQLINVAALPCKIKRFPSRYTTTPRRDKIPQKKRNLLVHFVELPTAVVEVDIKVTNAIASLTQNQCLQCVTPPLTNVEIPRPRDATELYNDGMIELGDVHYQTEPN